MTLKKTVNKEKYNAKTYDRFNFRIRKDGEDGITLEDIRRGAEATGESVNAFIIQALKDRLQQTK